MNQTFKTATMTKEPRNIMQEVRDLLAFHRLLGIDEYPASSALRCFLEAKKTLPAHPKPALPRLKIEAPPPSSKKTAPPPADQTKPSVSMQALRKELGECTRCKLHEKRECLVFGEGADHPVLLVVSDWPGKADDVSGLPFHGPEGEMLTNMLKAINLQRSEVYITNLVKCRPPQDRPPTREEIATCLPFLFRQISGAAPKAICAMGPLATQTLLGTNRRLVQLRGKFHDCLGVPLMPTFHPRFLLENPEMKRATWQDLLMIQKKCGR